jgi:hypothetical protein
MNVEKEGVLCNKEYNPASESQLYFLPPACSPGLSTRSLYQATILNMFSSL